mgnify:CR=1 FL=1
MMDKTVMNDKPLLRLRRVRFRHAIHAMYNLEIGGVRVVFTFDVTSFL